MSWKKKIFYLLAPLVCGMISGLLTRDSQMIYETAAKPPFAPPGWVFPVVWTVLYLLMGISACRVAAGNGEKKEEALKIFWIQLLVNVIWPWLFFVQGWYAVSFFWLILLILLVVRMRKLFQTVDPLAAKLQVPYQIWLLFAAYLNFAYYLMMG